MFNFNLIKKVKRTFFPFYKNSDLNYVFKKLQEDFSNQDKTAMFVGGCVRKYLFNEEIDDIDIATTLTVDQIKEKFKDTKFRAIDTGIEHGTVTLIFKELKLELTTLRKDIKTDGRHAEIEYTDNWHEDSNRRDFTINAIYLDTKGKIFDPQLGVADLKKNNIRFIGDPYKRIEEDHLRIIRYIRFSLQYESEPDPETIKAIKLNINRIKKISKERILSELFKIINLKNFLILDNNISLKEIFLLVFPEFKYLYRLRKLNKIPHQSQFDNTTLLAILLVDEENNHEYFSHKYNISNNLKENMNLLAKNFIHLQRNKNFLQKELKKNIFYFGKKHLNNLNILNFLCNKNNKLEEFLNNSRIIGKSTIPKFPFDGNFLKKEGIDEGTAVGKTLKLLEVEWLNNDFKISDKKVSKIINDQAN